MAETALILGASGHFGSNAARAFEAAGWTVRPFRRGGDMAAEAKGADLVVNALNPPNYHAWDRLIPEITASVLAAAKASGAAVLIPGNVYVFGNQPGPWGETTPHRPVARKGRIRAEMEARYRDAAAEGVRTIVLRGGDFIDPESPKSFLNLLVLKRLARGRILALGPPEAPRAWAFLPDMARAAAALAGMRDRLPAFADVPFPGHTFSTAELKAEIEAQTGRPLRYSRFPWWALTLAAPFWELGRELREMRYLYETPHSLSGMALARLLPDFAATPFREIVARHLKAQGIATSTQTSR